MGTYLLTGMAGFIASAVAELLLSEGHQVVGVDNITADYDVRLKEWRLGCLKGYANLTFHQADISDLDTMRQIWEASPRFDAVINLAARAGVRRSVENPWVYYATNTVGTLNLLELCKQYSVSKFVLASTSSVYGANCPMPYSEDADTSFPLSPYAASKKAAETLCYSYRHLYGIDFTIFRYFTVYGPAGRPDMSAFRFIQWISEGKPVTVFGDGTQTRDFTYVQDIARGTVAGLKPLGYEIINLGSNSPIVLNDAIQSIETHLGKKGSIEYKPAHTADVTATWANVGKAERLLGWTPKVSFEEGITNTIRWYQDNRSWASQVVTG